MSKEISFPRELVTTDQYRHANDVFMKSNQYTLKVIALIYNHQVQQYKLGNKYPLIQENDKIKFVKLVEPTHLSLM